MIGEVPVEPHLSLAEVEHVKRRHLDGLASRAQTEHLTTVGTDERRSRDHRFIEDPSLVHLHAKVGEARERLLETSRPRMGEGARMLRPRRKRRRRRGLGRIRPSFVHLRDPRAHDRPVNEIDDDLDDLIIISAAPNLSIRFLV